MGEFTGAGGKVRCVDCSYLAGPRCSKKDSKVAARKRRTCPVYDFKGEYVNRTSPEALHVPYVDKSTRRLVRKMMKLGIVPVSAATEEEPVYKAVPMPRSTATATTLTVGPQQTPTGELTDEPDSSGG